ncbi:MAG: hypothetical protein ACKVS6_05520 [Planctomycetota bacterium]
MKRPLAKILVITIVALLGACRSVPWPRGPVLIQTPSGAEQGVNTPYGIVFLGNTAKDGYCDVTMFFGDGPSIEPGRIRTVNEQLCRVDIDIKAPASEVSFTYPAPDDELLISVVEDTDIEYYKTRLAKRDAAGTVVEVPGSFPIAAAATGAPLYRMEDGRYRLIGLINGLVRYNDSSGAARAVLTYMGPRDLVPFTLQNHDQGRPLPPPRREDILR